MSDFAKIERLKNLSRQIDHETTKLSGGVPDPTSGDYRKLQEQVATWSQTIAHVSKDLKSRSHFNNMIHNQNRFGAGSYSAGQRFKSRQQNVQSVSSALGLVIASKSDFLSRLAAGDDPELRILKAVAEGLSQWSQTVKDSQTDLTILQPPTDLQQTITQLQPASPQGGDFIPPPGPMTTVLFIATLIALTSQWLRKKS